MKLTPENNPVTQVPLHRRMSPWNYRVAIEAGDRREQLYHGQSGVNAKTCYLVCISTSKFLGASVTIRMATLDAKREIGGWITKIERGEMAVDHEPYGTPLGQRTS